jgi:hypothetical protein
MTLSGVLCVCGSSLAFSQLTLRKSGSARSYGTTAGGRADESCAADMSTMLGTLHDEMLGYVASYLTDLDSFAAASKSCSAAAHEEWERRFKHRWPGWKKAMQSKLFVCGMTGGFNEHDATSQVEPLSSHDHLSFNVTANREGLFIGLVRGEGHIYVWGHRFHVLESLFPGSERRVPHPLRVIIPPSMIIPNPPQRFVHVSVGHGSFAAVASTGELYTTHLAPAHALPLLRKPLPFLAAEACLGGGDKEFCLIRGVNGELAGFGANDHGQLTRPGSADHVVMASTHFPTAGIAAGMNHTLVLDATGHAWSCGDNLRAQLGRDGSFNRKYHLGRVLLGHDVVQVAAGFNISALVKSSGALYTFGQGNEGGLGHGRRWLVDLCRPRRVRALNGYRVVSVAVGEGHMVAVTETGRAFSWGNNDDGQCGRKITEAEERASVNVRSAFYVRQMPLPGPVRAASAGFATCCILDGRGPPAPSLVPDNKKYKGEDPPSDDDDYEDDDEYEEDGEEADEEEVEEEEDEEQSGDDSEEETDEDEEV